MTCLLLPCPAAATLLEGSGSSLLGPLFSQWIPAYLEHTSAGRKTQLTMKYNPIGSGGGLDNIVSNASLWAGSEAVVKDSQYATAPGLQMLPVVSAPIAMVFNLPGITALTLTREIIARMFSYDILYWDDAAIQSQNQQLQLPHRRIEVVVRSGSSGTSFVMTSALVSFGWAALPGCARPGMSCEVTKRLGEVGFDEATSGGRAYTVKTGSSGLTSYVKATSYSIGYVGVATALHMGVSFGIVKNRAGVLTVANRQDSQLAADSSQYDRTTITANVHDKVGYPVLGIAYAVYWREFETKYLGATPDVKLVYCAKYFETVNFLYWIYTSAVSEEYIKSSNLVPLTAQVANQVISKLWSSSCDGVSWKSSDSLLKVAVDNDLTSGIVNTLSYQHHLNKNDSVVTTQFVEEGNPLVLSFKRMSARGADALLAEDRSTEAVAWLPVWSTPLVIVSNIGVPGLTVSIELDITTIQKILDGRITHWLHADIKGRNAHLPLPNKAITIVGHHSLLYPVLQGLEVTGAWADIASLKNATLAARRVLVNTTSEHEVAEYVSANTGSLAIVNHEIAPQWGLSEVHPVPTGGVSAKGPKDEGYPFYSYVFIGTPNALRTEERARAASANGTNPDEVPPVEDELASLVPTRLAAEEIVSYVAWLTDASPRGSAVHSTAARSSSSWILESEGLVALSRLPTNKEFINRYFERVTIDGQLVFPPVDAPTKAAISGTLIGIITASGVGLLLIFFIPALLKYHKETARVRHLQNNSTIAELSAECIADMRLEELEYLRSIKNPNRIQEAFIKIVDTLMEYRRYLPSSVLIARDGDLDGCDEDDLHCPVLPDSAATPFDGPILSPAESFLSSTAAAVPTDERKKGWGMFGLGKYSKAPLPPGMIGTPQGAGHLVVPSPSPGQGNSEDAGSVKNSAGSGGGGESPGGAPAQGITPHVVVHAQPRLSRFTVGLTKRRATVAAVSFDVSGDYDGSNEIGYLTLLEQVLAATSNMSRKTFVQVGNMGIVYLSWNTACPLVSHTTVGLDVTCALMKSFDDANPANAPETSERMDSSREGSSSSLGRVSYYAPSKVRYRVGVATGVVYCGNVGGNNSRVFVLNGPAVEKAELLAKYSGEVCSVSCAHGSGTDFYQGFCIADDDTVAEKAHAYLCYRVDYLAFSRSGKRQFLWAMTGKEQGGVSEWMYEMQQHEDERTKTLPGLATMMWDAVRKRETVKLKDMHAAFLRMCDLGQSRIVCDRLLRCTVEVLEDRDQVYFLSPFQLQGRDREIGDARSSYRTLLGPSGISVGCYSQGASGSSGDKGPLSAAVAAAAAAAAAAEQAEEQAAAASASR